MFCPMCGEKFETENQKFCPNCGSDVSQVIETAPTNENVQQPTISSSVPISSSIPTPQYSTTTSYKKSDEPGSYSKRSLAFGIISSIIALVTWYIGAMFFMIGSIIPISFLPPGARSVAFTSLAVTHGIGILFGILSIANAGKAKGVESENGVVKAGNVLGALGLAINLLLIFIALLRI